MKRERIFLERLRRRMRRMPTVETAREIISPSAPYCSRSYIHIKLPYFPREYHWIPTLISAHKWHIMYHIIHHARHTHHIHHLQYPYTLYHSAPKPHLPPTPKPPHLRIDHHPKHHHHQKHRYRRQHHPQSRPIDHLLPRPLIHKVE
jgi:hypothetical protein